LVDVLVGTSGRHETDWKGVLYPPKEPQDRWLALYADRFPTAFHDARTFRRYLSTAMG
jgi:uncharacterized protein YecE (DUF72 family)